MVTASAEIRPGRSKRAAEHLVSASGCAYGSSISKAVRLLDDLCNLQTVLNSVVE